MLIGGDGISNDVITLGTCFSMFVYNRARFRFALIGGNLTAQSTGSHRGIGGGIQIPEPRTQASSRYPSYQRRLGTESDCARASSANFPNKLDW